MRRTLLLLILAPSLAVGIFIGAFAFSELNVRGQSFVVSLSDFVFLNDGAFREALGIDVPPLTEARYRSVIGRFRQHTHHYVKHQAVWWLSRWGDATVPHLAAELKQRRDNARTSGAIRALGEIGAEIGSEAAVGALAELLETIDRGDRSDKDHRYAVNALGKIRLPSASRALIATYERNPGSSYVLAELGRTGTPEALRYLLALARDGVQHERYADDLIWGLAMSRSPEAARLLVGWMLAAEPKSARLCRDAIDQFMQQEAMEPLLDALAQADNDPLRATLLDLLDGAWVAGSPRAVALLEPLLDDPWIGSAARDTLARSGSREAWLAVHRHLAADFAKAWLADDGMFHVAYRFGAVALPELAQQLQAPSPAVRLGTVRMLPRLFVPEVRPYIEPLLADPDPQVARAARDAMTQLDKVELFYSFTQALPERFGSLIWKNFRPDWLFMDFTYEEGFEAVWNVFAWLHFVGLALSLLLGWALLTNALRVFESYRFTLFLLFLLAEGFIGDFLFCDHWSVAPALAYRIATAIHLLLMVGFLAHERERVPGELRNRFERLGGASLWLLLPLLLMLGTPVYADAMRLSLRQWPTFFAFCLVLALLTALVVEQALIPRHLMARRYGFERFFGFALSASLLTLFAASVWRLAARRAAAGDNDDAMICLLLLAPLPWFLLLHLMALRPREWFSPATPISPPPGERLRVVATGPEITLHLVPPVPLRLHVLRGGMKLAFILAVAGGVAVLAGRSGDLEAMVLAVFAGIIGAALAGMLLQGVAPRVVIQLRKGFIRFGRAHYGGILGGSPWLRRISMRRGARLAAHATRREQGIDGNAAPFDAGEWQWLRRLQQGGNSGLTGQIDSAAVALFARPSLKVADPVAGLPVEIALRNGGRVPVSLAALELASHGRFVTASVDGAPADLCFSRGMRELLIPPGADAMLTGRIFPPASVTGGATVKVALHGATVHAAPFRYELRVNGSA
jgi:HEAT repeat protein